MPRPRAASHQEDKPPANSTLPWPNLILAAIALGAFGVAYVLGAVNWRPWFEPKPPAGMRWIPGGEFTMGSDDADVPGVEHPAHRVRVDGFWMDETDVTNAQFRAFVEATGYKTTAESLPPSKT